MEIISESNAMSTISIIMFVFGILFAVIGILAVCLERDWKVGCFCWITAAIIIPCCIIKTPTRYRLRVNKTTTFGEVEAKYEILKYDKNNDIYIVIKKEEP